MKRIWEMSIGVRRHIAVGANRTVFSPDSPTRLCRAGIYRAFLPAWRHVVVAGVHEHLDVIQDSGIQVLCFINGEKKRLAFFFVKIGDLFLDSLEHPGFVAFSGTPRMKQSCL